MAESNGAVGQGAVEPGQAAPIAVEAGGAHPTPAEQRVGVIRGDRLCERCGFNLCGQMVLREGHYGLLIARCPECGAVAPMQEYPRRSKWAGRAVALGAAALVLTFVVLLVATAAAGWGAARGVAAVASRPMGTEISTRFLDDVMKKVRQEPLPAQWTQAENVAWYHVLRAVNPTAAQGFTWGGTAPPPQEVIDATDEQIEQARQLAATTMGWWDWVDMAWWQQQNRRAIRRAAGSGWGEIPVEVWLAVLALAVLLGMGLAVAQAHRGRLGLALWTLAPIGLAVAAGLIWPPSVTAGMWGWGGPGTVVAHGLAQRELWPVALGVTLGLGWLGLLAGAMIGRPAARLALRAMLPPRLVGAFAGLWLCDGKPPPRGGACH